MQASDFTMDGGKPIAWDMPDAFAYPVTATLDDCDQQGHVNNAVYVRWMGKAAYGHSCAVGYDWQTLQSIGGTFVVRRHEVDYLSPAFASDALVVATWPVKMRKFSAGRRHQMVRLRDGKTLVRAHSDWIYLDLKTGRPKRMPQAMIEAFRPRDA